jgi:hypothetical protein
MFGKRKPKPDVLFEISNDAGDHFVGQVPDSPGTQAELKKLFKAGGAVPDTDESLGQLPASIAKRVVSSRDKAQHRFRIEKEYNKNEDLEPDSDFEPEETDNDEIIENNEVRNDWPKQYRYGHRY